MKLKLLAALMFLFMGAYSQTAQKGLLWKITGNGLSKPSYIYGNMHVSSKIAFHLGEEFFDAIQSVDMIALESNPIIWLDEIMNSDLAYNYIGSYDIGSQRYKGFYKYAFKHSLPTNEDFGEALAQNHYFMNWLLYRENKGMQDFEEETFLDMFIYQSGAKNGKPVISLEDFKETTSYFEYSQLPDEKQKEYSQWYKKMLEDKSYSDLMSEAYRNQDLSLIDSLQNEVSSDNSLKYMIYLRNEIMAKRIDSVLQLGKSLFSGVGAAHLPGDKGMLRLLEKMGYTVTPMPVTFTDKARKLREQFDDKKVPYSSYKDFNSDLFRLKSPVMIYETPYSSGERQFFGPELTNGAHVTVKQISTYSFLRGASPHDYLLKIDSLLFENIPGKIISKQEFKTNFFEGYDIVNKTKTGDFQRYKIYIAPFSVLIFKMGGKDEFVKENGNFFFDNIVVKEPGKEWKSVSPISSEWSVDVPDYYTMSYNNKVNNLYGSTFLQAFDISDSSYYFLDKSYLHDYDFIEEDEFELKRLAEKFYKNLKIDSIKTEVVNFGKYPSAISLARTADSSYIKVMVVINGPNYYLLTQVSKTGEFSDRFFKSLKFSDMSYQFAFEEKFDSLMYFKTKSQYLVPDDFRFIRQKAIDIKQKSKKLDDTDFLSKTKSFDYYSENSEAVEVVFYKFHDFKGYENVDSLWKNEIEDVVSKNWLKIGEQKKSVVNGDQVMEVLLTDTASSRAIFVKFVLHGGVLYSLKTVTDTNIYLTRFVREFYDNFTPFDTLIGRSPFEDKARLFFNYIYGTDSLLKERAFKSVNQVKFQLKDADSLKLTIENYSFGPKNSNVKESLIFDYGSLKTGVDFDFLKKQYQVLEDTSMYQLAILRALSYREEREAEKDFLKLLNYDVPISGDEFSSSMMFFGFFGKEKYNSKLFPELLDYTFVDSYNSSIIEVLAHKVDSGFIHPKVYKKHVPQLLREAKLVLKAQISKEQTNQANENSNSDYLGEYYSYNYYRNNSESKEYMYEGNELLENYIIVLMPFYDKADVKDFIKKAMKSKDLEVQNLLVCQLLKHKIPVDTSVINFLASDIPNVAGFYRKLTSYKLLEFFPEKYQSQELFAKSSLFNDDFDFEKDSIEFVEKRYVNTGKVEGYVYFFKTKELNDDYWELCYIGVYPMDEKEMKVKRRYSNTNQSIKKSKPISEMIDEAIRVIELKTHPRADGSDNNYSGYYYDYDY